MTNLLKLGKKIFTVGVVATTIFWSLGVAALVPAVANAATETDCATLMAGDLVKTSVSPVIYAVNADKTKSYFPQGDSFKSWTADNKYTYKLIAQSCLSSLKSATAVLPRPGTYLVKEQAADAVYMVLPGNKLAELSAEAAKALYGTNYMAMPAKGGHTITMDDPSWTFYSQLQVGGFGVKITESLPTAGALVKVGATYYVVGANKVLSEVTATGLTANRFQTKFAHVLTATTGFTMSAAKVEAQDAVLTDRTQGAAGPVGGTSTTPAVPAGALTVSLSADTAAATTLSASTVYNNVLTIKLSAGSEGATVNGLTVKKAGLVLNSNISGVSVWVNGYRKGDVMSSFNSDNKVSVGFTNSAIVIPANGFVLVSVAFNLGSGATGGTVAAQIAAATDIDTKASVGGTFPITGNTFGLTDGSATLASVTIVGQSVGGQSAEPVSGDTGQMEIGQTKEVAKFKFTEAGTNDATIEKLTFFVAGTVKEKDLQNFELYAPDNSLLGSAASVSDRYLTINLKAPYKLPKGTNRTLTLKATAMDGSGNWFQLQLQSDSDVMVKDGGNSFYVLPLDSDGGAWSAATSTTGYFKLKSGALTVTKSTDSPSANLAKGSTNVLLAKFDVKAVGEAVEVRKLQVTVVTTTATATKLAGNLKVVVDGSTILTQAASAASLYSGLSGPTQYTLSQYVTIKSGETKVFEVYGDIDAAAAATSAYQIKIGKAYVKRLSTLDFQDNQPNDIYAANSLSLGGNTPSIAKDTSLGNKTLAPGGSAQVLGRWVIKAPEAEEIDVTALNISFANSGLTVATYLQNLALYSGDVQLGASVSVVASTSNSFTFTLNVPKNVTKDLTLKGTIIGSALTDKTVSTTISSLTYVGKTSNSSTDDTTGYAGQQNTINSATVAMTAASDGTTQSKVLLPSASQVQLGKWKVTVTNQDVVYNKLRLYTVESTTTLDTSAGNFGSLSLYEAGKETTPLATGSYLPGSGNGYVEFTGMNWTVPADSVKYLVLKGPVNGSGTMDTASYNAWTLGATSTTNLDILAGGSNISTNVTVTSPTSTFYLFHNSSPKIVKNNIGTSLGLNSQAQIFSYTVYNNGDRELTLATSSVYVSVSGLTGTASATGTISSFKLWNADAAGVMGTNLASASTAFGQMCLGGQVDLTAGCAAQNSTTTVFGGFSETVTVPAGGSRSFVVTADTTDVLDGKSQGTVSVSAMFDGAIGYSNAVTSGQSETHWGVGKLLYFYTPVGGSVNGTAYGASDSYDVVGDTLTRSA